MTSLTNPTAPTTTAGGIRSGLHLPTVNRQQLWVPAAILVAALLVFAGWMTLVSPQREQASTLRAQAASENSTADALQRQISTLEAQSKDMAQYRDALAQAQAALPTTSALPAFLRSLQDISTRAGVTVTGVSATPPVAVDGDGQVIDTDDSAPAAPTEDSIYRTTMTVTATGAENGLSRYIQLFQDDLARAVHVTNVSAQDGADGPSVTFTLYAFFAPGAATSAPTATEK